jgi:hypothetical protein
MKNIRPIFLWDLFLIAGGATGWHLAGRLRLLWWDYTHQRLLKESGAIVILDNPPPMIPELLVLVGILVFALTINRNSYVLRPKLVRCALLLAGAVGITVLSAMLGIGIDVLYYAGM